MLAQQANSAPPPLPAAITLAYVTLKVYGGRATCFIMIGYLMMMSSPV